MPSGSDSQFFNVNVNATLHKNFFKQCNQKTPLPLTKLLIQNLYQLFSAIER